MQRFGQSEIAQRVDESKKEKKKERLKRVREHYADYRWRQTLSHVYVLTVDCQICLYFDSVD